MKQRTVVAALGAALLVLAACGRDDPGAVPPPRDAVPVSVVRPTEAGGAVQVPATVRSVERAELATRVSGTIRRVPVDVGDRVVRGSVLLALDDADLAAQIARAEAEVDRAKRSLARIAPLEADGAATAQELDDAAARVRVAEAELAAANAQHSYAVLRAPFDGHVVARTANPGDLAVPGRPVLVVAGAGGLKAVADLPASRSGRVAPGDRVGVVLPHGAEVEATVGRVSAGLDAAARSFRVEVELPDVEAPGLVDGAFVRLLVPEPGRRSLWVPEGSLVREGQLEGVYAVADDTARVRWVRTGERRGGRVEVLAGLAAEERIVAVVPVGLRDGSPVLVAAEAP